MQYHTNVFLNELRQQAESHLQMAIRDWQNLTPERLSKAPLPGKWSAAQCLQHLNFYGRHYISACRMAMIRAQERGSTPLPMYKPGWLGAKFTRMMMPGGKPMASPKNARPAEQPDPVLMLQEFIEHNEQLLQLLGLAEKVNLEKIRVPTSLSALIRLQLGDTFAFYLAHQARHILQIQRALAS